MTSEGRGEKVKKNTKHGEYFVQNRRMDEKNRRWIEVTARNTGGTRVEE